MNVDRRMLSPVPSMDSGSEGEENLRISRNLSTHTQYLEGGWLSCEDDLFMLFEIPIKEKHLYIL